MNRDSSPGKSGTHDNVEPSFVLYALLLDPGCCLRAHIILVELVEPEGKKKEKK